MNDQDIKKLAKRGLVAVIVRQFLVQAVGLAAWIVLANRLDPIDFGLFAATSLAVQAFSIVSDLGFGLALVRKKDEPRQGQLDAGFSLQLISSTIAHLLAGATVLAILGIFTGMAQADRRLVWLLVLSSWLGSFRIIPTAILERDLKFTRIALAELVENIVFSLIAVAGALSGWGIWSLATATAARSVVGTGLLTRYSQYRPRLSLQLAGMKETILTGFSFQSLNVVSFLKDLATPAFVVAMVGTVQFGYFVWARDLTFKLITFSRLFGRIAVSASARLSADKDTLFAALRRSSNLLGLFYWPAATFLIGASGFFIPHVFSDKWMPSQPLVVVFAVLLLFQVWGSPMWSIIQTQSPATWPVRTVVLLTIFELCFGFVGVFFYGILGAAMALLGSTLLANLLYVIEIKRLFPDRADTFQPLAIKFMLNGLIAAAGLIATNRLSHDFSAGLITTCVVLLLTCLVSDLMSSEDRRMLSELFATLRTPGKVPLK